MDNYFDNETHRWLKSDDKNFSRTMSTAVIRGVSERDDGVLFVIPVDLINPPGGGGSQWRQMVADGRVEGYMGLSHEAARELAEFILNNTPGREKSVSV